MQLAGAEDEEGAALADPGQAHLLPLALHDHVVGRALLDVMHQLQPGRGRRRGVEVDVEIAQGGVEVDVRGGQVEVDVQAAAVQRRLGDEARLLDFLGGEGRGAHQAVVRLQGVQRRGHRVPGRLLPRRDGDALHLLEALLQQPLRQVVRRGGFQAGGMGGQQLGKKRLLGCLRVLDQGQAFVDVLHQGRQLEQEGLTQLGVPLGLNAQGQFAAGSLHALSQGRIGPVAGGGHHLHPAPDLGQEVPQEIGQLDIEQFALQHLHVALLHPQIGFLGTEQGRDVGAVGGVLRRFGFDEGFEFAQLGLVEIHAVEVTVHDVIDQAGDARQAIGARALGVVVKRGGQRGHAVHEAPYGVLA